MGRTIEIEIGGKTFRMCFTLWAFGQVCERYESLPKYLAKLDELVSQGDNLAAMDEYLWLLSILLDAQYQRESWEDGETEPPPEEKDLPALFSPGDFVEVQRKVLDCISLGNSRTVGVDAPKNGGGAGDAPAPES